MPKRNKINLQLNKILSKARALKKTQVDSEEATSRATQIRQHLSTLRKKYGILKRNERLRRPRKTVKDKILAMPKQEVTIKDLNNGVKKVLENIIESSSKENILLAYRFTGKSMFPLDDNKMGIRLDTFFGGNLFVLEI